MFSILKKPWSYITSALSKARRSMTEGVRRLLERPVDQASLEMMERLLCEADFGRGCAQEIIASLQGVLRSQASLGGEALYEALREEVRKRLPPNPEPAARVGSGPQVFLVIGINGHGKTTTIAKLAHAMQAEGLSVLMGAGDTYRAAAAEQLGIWASRLGCDCVRGPAGGDPAAVAYDACQAGIGRHRDVVLIDTAGRLQNKDGLMAELRKMGRVLGKVVEGAPHEVLLVLDATTGQNALEQARAFHECVPITGCVLTKLDGSARGGMLVALYQELGLRTLWIGTGEGLEDLVPFDREAYLEGLFPPASVVEVLPDAGES